MASLAMKAASLNKIMWTRRSGRRDGDRGATDRYDGIIHVRYTNKHIDDRPKQQLTSRYTCDWNSCRYTNCEEC